MDEAALRDWLVEHVTDVLDLTEPPSLDAPLDELGLSSRDALVLAGDLEDVLGRPVPPTVAWEAPSLRLLAAHLAGTGADGGEVVGDDAEVVAHVVTPPVAPVDDAGAVAVVGVGIRVPGASGPEQFWDLLVGGRDAVGDVPEGRWESIGLADGHGRVTTKGGFLDDIAGFDADYFGVSPREAELVDPQQRILLEVVVEALHHARIDPASLRGSATGVFVGVSASEYGHLTASDLDVIEPYTATGAATSITAGRVSYALDLRGPSVAVDTACSSSLVAVHDAARSLRDGDSDLALAAGVNLLLSPLVTASFERAGALAPDGRCKSFGAAADGIGRAEGCGVLVLERLTDARAKGHRVLALVRGTAVNSDGRSNGLTAPNPAAQQAVLRRALERAGVEPATVDYVEAHGTGTPLGDPIEAAALGAVLGAGRPDGAELLLGSVKSNLGHLEAAAGVAGVAKVVLALHHDVIPPTLHAEPANPRAELAARHLALVTAARPWPRHGGVARAGVSGFGFGGTNAHVVLEQAPAAPTSDRVDDARPAVPVLAVSGRTPERTAQWAASLADWLATGHGAGADLAAVARSLGHGPQHGPHRLAVAAATPAEAVVALRAATPAVPASAPDRPVFVFAGYGQQWAGMARDLLADDAVFAASVADVARALGPHTGVDVVDLLASGTEPEGVEATMLALFAVQLGLAAVWRARGVEPAAVIGHSMGEVAAAVVAGALDLVDAARVAAVRARLLASVDSAGAGAMAVLDLPAADVVEGSDRWPGVEVAVHGSPAGCTVAGPADDVATLVAHVESLGRDAWPLRVSGAGHSAAVEPILQALAQGLAGVAGREPAVRWYGTVLDDPRTVPTADTDYWVANARRAVRFTQAVAAALADGHDLFLEISAHPVAAHGVRATAAAAGVAVTVAGSLRRDTPDHAALAANVAVLHAAGHPAVLGEHQPDGPRVDVPAPPWRHRPFWFTRRAAAPVAAVPGATVLGVTALGPPVVVAGGDVRLWTREDLWPAERPLDVLALAALAAGALVAAGLPAAPVTSATVAPGPAPTGRGLVSLTVRGDGAEVEVFAADGDGWRPVGRAGLGAVVQAATVAPDSAVPAAVPTVQQTTVPADAVRAAATPAAAAGVALATLREVLAEVSGLDAATLDVDAALVDLGVDSLVATRARHAVERDFGVPLPARVLLQGGSLRALAAQVAADVRGEVKVASSTPTPAAPAAAPVVRRVPPRDPTERFLVGLWREVLETADLGVTAPVAGLGADALCAVRVAEAIRQRVGRSPAAAELLAAGTVEAMADLVRGDFEGTDAAFTRAEPVTVLRAGGARRPLVLFHPAGGPCSVYRPLVDRLPADLPVLGMERLDHLDDVEARAAEYERLLRERQPEGPYRLMGWSLGGVLAGEVAQRLVAAGERVDLLASIDTTLPRTDPHADPRAEIVERYRRFTAYLAETYGVEVTLPADIADREEGEQIALLGQAMVGAGVALPAGVLRHQYTSYVDARAAERHTLKRWDGRMVLYRATDVEALTARLDPRYDRTDLTLGWEETVADLVVVRVPGNHITMIDPPHVDVLARDLAERLAVLDGSEARRASLEVTL